MQGLFYAVFVAGLTASDQVTDAVHLFIFGPSLLH